VLYGVVGSEIDICQCGMVSYSSPLFSSGKERMMVVFSNLNSNLCMRIGRAEVRMKCSYPQSFVMKCESKQKSPPPTSGIVTHLTLINCPNRVSLFNRTSKAPLKISPECYKVGYKPIKTLHILALSKTQIQNYKGRNHVIYKINCSSCDFVHCTQS